MQLYRISGRIEETVSSEEENINRTNADWRAYVRRIAGITQVFNDDLKEKAFIFPVSIQKTVTIGVLIRKNMDCKSLLTNYLKKMELILSNVEICEVTIGKIANMLRAAEREDLIEDDDEILHRFNLSSLVRASKMHMDESILDPVRKTQLYKKAAETLAEQAMFQELDRVYAGCKTRKAYGHPVHYLIRSNDPGTCSDIVETLAGALYNNRRIRSRRVSTVKIDPCRIFSSASFNDLYMNSYGGLVVLQIVAEDDCSEDIASYSIEIMEEICDLTKEYRNDVLTVLCLPRDSTVLRSTFYENSGTMSIVELVEEPAKGDRAINYLKHLASMSRIPVDDELLAMVDADTTYVSEDLRRKYDDWYNHKLKTEIYPQYREFQTAKNEVAKENAKGSAYEQLMELVGLDSAKNVISHVLDYKKAQKVFADRGMQYGTTSMHMVFTGNPGTAKTTVARLYARILRDNGILSKGNLVEVGRGDLVGKYVGWTAPTIQKKFREATGGVLFIDEAYSLVDDRSGSYGDEAINTIVQEMENHREDVMVIFAGYPDKMEEFLRKNPGMRSRIAWHVSFEDYSVGELCRIAELIAEKKGYRIHDGALEKLNRAFELVRKQTDFGNGRYVRNIMEKAGMAQSSRLLHMDYETLSDSELRTILPEDIEVPAVEHKACHRIGF